MIRFAATDLDGTLLRSDGTVAAGSVLALVTGRPPRGMAPVARATGHTGGAICANGALLYDLHTERVVGSDLLDTPVALAAVATLRAKLPGLSFAAEFTPGFGHEASYRHGWDLGEVEVALTVETRGAEHRVELLAALTAAGHAVSLS